MKKNYYFILILLFIFGEKASAQSSFNAIAEQLDIGPSINTTNYLPLSNYHFFNPYYFNPAMAGIDDKKQLSADWNRQENHSFFASYEQPIASINSAIGMQFSYTSNYQTAVRHYGLAYNYGFKFEEEVVLKLGLQFSQTSISINESFIGFGTNKKKWYNSPAMDIGLALQAKQLRFGVSVQNLFPSEIISADGITTFFDIANGERQVNLSIANTFRLSEKLDWSLAALVRSSESNKIHDLSSYLSFRKRYFVGTTFRTSVDYHWIGFVGVKIKEKLNLQFSFNAKKEEYDDHRFFEALVQYQFK